MNEEKNTNESVNTKQLAIIIGAAILALLGFVAVYFVSSGYFNKDNGSAPSQNNTEVVVNSPSPSDSPDASQVPEETKSSSNSENTNSAPKTVENTKYTFEQAMNMAQEVAKKQFGDDAVVLPASDKAVATIVNINGVDRPCFMFGAESMSKMIESGSSMRGLYHFDANTGEVFDNGSGEMVKVN